jgi:hypothetical protein
MISKQLRKLKETCFVHSQHVYISCVIPPNFVIQVLNPLPIPFKHWGRK